MFVNGSLVPNTTVWQQTLKVQPNTRYAFSVWVVSLSRPEIPALLQFALVFPNGTTTPLGAIYTAPPTSCNWEQHFETWVSGNQDSVVTLRLVNQNTNMGGNDFGIDDLSFAAVCASEHPFTVEVRTTDSTRLTLATCDPAQVGETSVRLRNRFGCDSLVVTRRILNTQAPRIETLNATTCQQSEVRIQRDTFRNGICDTLIRMTNVRLQSNLPEKRIDIIN